MAIETPSVRVEGKRLPSIRAYGSTLEAAT